MFRDFFIFREIFIFSEIFIFRDFFYSEIFLYSVKSLYATKLFLKIAVSKMLSFSVEQTCWSPFDVHLQAFLRTFLRLLLEKETPQ